MSRKAFRMMIRTAVWCVLGLYLAVYVAAKANFLNSYGRLGFGAYLRQHVWFWIGLLVLGFLAWLLGKICPESSNINKP